MGEVLELMRKHDELEGRTGKLEERDEAEITPKMVGQMIDAALAKDEAQDKRELKALQTEILARLDRIEAAIRDRPAAL